MSDRNEPVEYVHSESFLKIFRGGPGRRCVVPLVDHAASGALSRGTFMSRSTTPAGLNESDATKQTEVSFGEENMRSIKRSILLFAVAATLALVSGQAAEKTMVTGTEMFDPFNLFQNGTIGQIMSPGTIDCPGNLATGDPMQPCPAGSRIQTRGLIVQDRWESSDPRATGNNTVEHNAAFDADGTGQAWGTFSLAVDTGGVWQGTWNATRSFVEDHWVSSLRAVGHGRGGSVEGLVLKLDAQIVTYTPMPIAYIGTFSGTILDPHEK